VEQVFDAISYCKGGSVVRMICAVLGKKAFQRGLAAYMAKHKYGNTETYDLWDAWEQASGMPVRELTKSWTEQMGFPMLTVTKESWESNQVVLEVHQQWFLSDGSELSDEEARKKWTIPIITCTADGTQIDMTLMREKTGTITIPLTSSDGWVKLNANQEVPMRVCNTPEMLRRLEDGIRSKSMRPSDRAAILADTYAFVKAGKTAPEILVKLLKSYDKEDSYIVWQGLAGVLQGLDIIIAEDPSMKANFSKLARNIVLGLLSHVGWEPTESDEHLTVLLRSVLISLLGSFCYDDESVATEAKQRFAKFLQDPNDVESLPTDMRTPVFQIILKTGGKVEYDQLVNYYNTTTDNAERKLVLSSLGHSSDPTLKYKTLEWSISGAVKVQDFFYAMGSVANSSKDGRDMSWKFFQDNLQTISNMIGQGSSSLMDACIVSCVGSSASWQLANDVEEFFTRNPQPRSARKIAQTLETLRANAKFWEQLQKSALQDDSFWESLLL
jgi:puromycin-sensitive aminopeptidase